MVDIKEKLEKGYIHARIIIELMGKPKEHIEKTIKEYLKRISEDENFELLSNDIAEIEPKDEYFVTFAEIEILCKDVPSLVGFCFDYMPSSIEIIEPEKINYDRYQLSSIINDLQARLHQVDAALKTMRSESMFLRRNASSLLKNLIAATLRGQEVDMKTLVIATGVEESELKQFLEHMKKEGLVEEHEGKFKLAKKK